MLGNSVAGNETMITKHDQQRTAKRRAVFFAIAAIAIAVPVALIYRTSAAAPEKANDKKDPAASRTAFLEVYKVLMSPRCMNCHPDGDRPLQGDDNHLHTMNVKRGDAVVRARPGYWPE